MGRLIHRGFFRQGDIHDKNTTVPHEVGNKIVATDTEWQLHMQMLCSSI
jgi:hypothetical protein